jgi:hypothetical protein
VSEDDAEDAPVDPPNEDGESAPGDGDDGERAPLSDVAEAVEGRSPVEDDPFEEMDGPSVDRETLWRQVAGEEATGAAVDRDATAADADRDSTAAPDTDADDAGPTVDRPDASRGPTDPEGRAVRVVAKQKYCQNCEYLSSPPEVACGHEGTEILEQVDMEHFRVADCPVVREDEELENA